MASRIFVIILSILGVVSLCIAILEANRIAIVLTFVFFTLSFLEEKTNLICVKIASRTFLALFIALFIAFFINIFFSELSQYLPFYSSTQPTLEELQAELARRGLDENGNPIQQGGQ